MLIEHGVDTVTPLDAAGDRTFVVEFQSGPGFRITSAAALHLAQQLLVALTDVGTLPPPNLDDIAAVNVLTEAAADAKFLGHLELADRLRHVIRTRFGAVPRHDLDIAVAERLIGGVR
ncbi:hypothetical protein [Nocardia africana]|uniref:Uncharacterized protein n=1 Tax=Nocardia africana TaxID=134964 RepID=A0A378X355_9NOCA|nr:hypothetical protein [Nocardia africana]MCC3311484.1 hypothetical protein [Nocardia africana]SUA47255.1 Uncharacterised protein [Nocardia africana]